MTGSEGFSSAQSFSAVWHAQLFALTVHLYNQGVFTWPEWTAALGRQLAVDLPDDDARAEEDSYYLAWMAALTACLQDKSITDSDHIQAMSERWAAAYLATPHGQPVTLSAELE